MLCTIRVYTVIQYMIILDRLKFDLFCLRENQYIILLLIVIVISIGLNSSIENLIVIIFF